MSETATRSRFILFTWLRQLYHWALKWADHRHNVKALSILSFVEAFIFPIPPDPLLLAMGAGKPHRAIWYAAVTTVSSILGGLAGYMLGYFVWELTSGFFFQYVFSEATFYKVVETFQNHTFVSLFVAALTPIPFKVFTVAGGVAHLPIVPFILASIVGRGLRFFTLGLIMYKFGKPAMRLIEKHFEILSVVFAVLLIAGFYVLKVVL